MSAPDISFAVTGEVFAVHLAEQLPKLRGKTFIKNATILAFILSYSQNDGRITGSDAAATLADRSSFKFQDSPFLGTLRGAPTYELLDTIEKLVSKGLIIRLGNAGHLQVAPSGLQQLRAWGVDTLGAAARTPEAERRQHARRRALLDASAQALEGLCAEQLQVMDAVVSARKSIFFTGAAGTGKTYTLRRLVSLLKSNGTQVAVTASTGVAACALGGSTIHSWSGMGRATEGVEALAARAANSRATKQRWQNAQVLVLDEVSMIDAEFLDKLDVVARRCRGCSRLPFGGMQMVFVGDFCQLPPVAPRGGSGVRFAFQSAAWRAAVRSCIVLKQVYRQATDLPFIRLLSRLRFGQVDSDAQKQLKGADRGRNAGSAEAPAGELTRLSAKNDAVDTLNARKLKELPGDGCVYAAQPRLPSNPYALPRSKKLLAQLQGSCPARAELTLRVGAAVMLLHNLDVQAGLTNGTRGTVVGFDFNSHHSAAYRRSVLGQSRSGAEMSVSSGGAAAAASGASGAAAGAGPPASAPPGAAALPTAGATATDPRAPPLPIVQFTAVIGGQNRVLDPFPVQLHDFEVQEDAQHWAALRQVPLALAWAVTIHKSQGMTLHNVHIDCNGIFETGQTYVALSRASSLGGMSLSGFNPEHVKAHPVALAFHTSIGDGPHVATAATPSPARPPAAAERGGASPAAAAAAAGGSTPRDTTVRALAFSPAANRAPAGARQPQKRPRESHSRAAGAPPAAHGASKRPATTAARQATKARAVVQRPGSKSSAASRLQQLLQARKVAAKPAPRRAGGW